MCAAERVAIVDDDPQEVSSAAIDLVDAGFEPIELEGSFSSTDELVTAVVSNADAALCDHRLSPMGKASFSGAEAVAKLYERQIPAVLVTTFAMDAEVEIRLWRQWIPALVLRPSMSPETLIEAIDVCRQEIAGLLRPDRQPHRALARVESVTTDSGREVADVIVPQWDAALAVRLPLDLVDVAMRGAIQQGTRLMCSVNTAADRSEDLYFAEVGIAPEPMADDELN